MIYKPEREYHLTIDNYEVNDFVRVWVNHNVKAEKLIVKIFQAMGFTKINHQYKDGFKAEKTPFNIAFAENMKAALEKAEFPTTIPYIPRFNATKENIGLDHFTIAYLYKKEKQGKGHTAQLEDSVVILETKNPRREAVAWLYYFMKLKNLDEEYLIDVPGRAKRTEATDLINGKKKKLVERLPNPFGSFGKMMSLEGLDADSNLNLLYAENASQLSTSQARKLACELASKQENDHSIKEELTDNKEFGSSQESTIKDASQLASLQSSLRATEQALPHADDSTIKNSNNDAMIINKEDASENNQEPLDELELEELYKNCFDSLDKLLPDLQKHLKRGVKKAQSILPFGNGQEVLNFSMLDQRNESIYLLELEFRTKLSTSNVPVVIQFLIDFEGRSISINNYLNDPNNSYDGQEIEQFIALFKDALEKSLEVGHQFDLASIKVEANEKEALETSEKPFYSLLAQAYWRAIDLDESQKFEMQGHDHIYHVERLSSVINDYLNDNESFFRDHRTLNKAIDHPTLKTHPLKALRQLYDEEAPEEDKLKRIKLICKKLVAKDKAARKGIELILQSIENDSQPLVDLPLLVIKEDQKEKPKKKTGRVKLNKEIEALIDKKGTESKDYTQEEIGLLSRYSGYGGSKLSEINKGLLYEYYTPDELVRMMWILAREFGYNNGSVLEPSCGTGNFIRYAPIGARIEGYETNKYSARICQLLYPHANIHNKSFETLFFNGNIYLNGNFRTEAFDLVIGNPPYGEFTGTYAGLGEKKRTKAKNYEHYFIKRGLDLLNPEGLLVYVIPNSFLANGNSYNSLKGEIALKCTLEFAFRLSSEVFQHTSIETDIIVLRKRKI